MKFAKNVLVALTAIVGLAPTASAQWLNNVPGTAALDIRRDTSGNSFVVTNIPNTPGSRVTKYDLAGNLLWKITYPEANHGILVNGTSITLLNESSSHATRVHRVDTNGVAQWDYTMAKDRPEAISRDSSGNVLFLTETFSGVSWRVTKLSDAGAFVWRYSDDYSSNALIGATWNRLLTDASDNIFVLGTGNVGLVDGKYKYTWMTKKLNRVGTLKWSRTAFKHQDAQIIDGSLDSVGNLFVLGKASAASTILRKYGTGGNKVWDAFPGNGDNGVLVGDDDSSYVLGSGGVTKVDMLGGVTWSTGLLNPIQMRYVGVNGVLFVLSDDLPKSSVTKLDLVSGAVVHEQPLVPKNRAMGYKAVSFAIDRNIGGVFAIGDKYTWNGIAWVPADKVFFTRIATGDREILLNGGFESGIESWNASANVIYGDNPHGGSLEAWLGGYGVAHTTTLYQTVAIPAGVSFAKLKLWLYTETDEPSASTAFDTLQIQIRSTAGTFSTLLERSLT
jgi:hypothetical protein